MAKLRKIPKGCFKCLGGLENFGLSSRLGLAQSAYLLAEKRGDAALADAIVRHAMNLKNRKRGLSDTCDICGRADNKRYSTAILFIYGAVTYCLRKRCIHKALEKKAEYDRIERKIHQLNRLCSFLTYRGLCELRADKGLFCEEHGKQRCIRCGRQATTYCFHTSWLGVCGNPLCSNSKSHRCPYHKKV
jgi:hypothetical protein